MPTTNPEETLSTITFWQGPKAMSPRHSDYRSEEFDFDQEYDFTYRRQGNDGEVRSTPRPTNRPSRQRKVKTAYNGIQRRRNKHWNW